jgi:uncharacterized repeat protein (TIGR01451 family)
MLSLLSTAGTASAAPCDLKNNPPAFVRHDLTTSYCELCGYGYITIIVSNPYEGVDMTSMTVVENLNTSGLTFDPTAPMPVTYRINGGPLLVGSAPLISGANGSILTWTSAQIPDLGRLEYQPSNNSFGTIAITFSVSRTGALSQEGLVSATRLIEANLTYSTDESCFSGSRTVTTGLDILPLREPHPNVSKRGRNVDASQGSGAYSQTVYGNINDDVIWRIRVSNTGLADLQDLRFDDLMEAGNVEINYACPTEASASAVAANNGVNPGGGGCVPAGNYIDNFDVDNPFGNPGSDSPDQVDVQQGQSADIYLVGKIPASPNSSCVTNKTNTVSDIQWGCEADSPAGGITATSTGSSPGNASAYLSTLSVNSGSNLNIQTEIVGTNTSQPAGSKGTVRITIRNNTGGTVKGIKLRDVLPPEYVVDSTFTPTVTATGAYGSYPGMTDRIEWTNPVAGTFPLTTSDPAVALSNTAPEFRLYSSTTHPIYADQFDMLRNGDRLVITFRIVLIRPQSYDKTANLDVRTEAPNSDPPGTDPDNSIQLTNQLYVDFEDFCQPGVIKHPPTNPLVTTHQSDPEDLDIDIAGSELIFILTNDQSQPLPLTVNLSNHGGHDAADYFAYVTFGATMNVTTVPSGCSITSNPPPLDVWRDPATIPPDATVYQCTGSAIAPGQTRSLHFEVVKSTDPADIAADDLTFRADVVGEITLSDGTPLWFPTPVNPRADGGIDAANNYSLDGIRSRVIGFNLLKSQVGTCTENNPPPTGLPDTQVQIGEECSFHIEAGGWFGFQTPGFALIAVQNIKVIDQLPDGQGYISSTDPYTASTSAIQSISLNPPGLAPLDEVAGPEWMNWTFNPSAQRITIKDQWFRADMTSRLLNDPIDTSAAPNQHAAPSTNVLNSYFQAIFDNDATAQLETYDLGPNTVGYPRESVRRFDLTVTEPHINVVKEVCNESLYGTGTGCSHFVPLADDGDAYNSYIYRITLTNEASSGGVQRAPAYDVTVTDRLDASDLSYVLPFATDGLDNDGDGSSGGADTDGEGVISDNTVKNGTPAVITFSYTNSNVLQRIDPGQSVQLYYRVDYDDDAAPLQTFTNAADATYDSLEGVSGHQSAPQQPNSDKGGARVYTSQQASAAVRIIPVATQPKTIARLSNTPAVSGPTTQGVSVGEEIEYRLNTLLPVALLRNFVIRDELPAGMRCSEAPAVNLNAAPYSAAGFVPGGIITPTCSGTTVEWNFGDQRVTQGTAGIGNRYDFEIGFIARVENTSGTNDGDIVSNGVPATQTFARYIDETGSLVSIDFGQVDVQVHEPRISLTKTFAVANADAGDILTVTVAAENTGTATAYNLRVLDDLAAVGHLTFLGNVGGADPPDNIDTATLGANRPIFSWNAANPKFAVAPGETRTFTFEISVDTGAQPQEVLDNTIQASWTSLPGNTTALNSTGTIGADGSQTGMRIGALPNAGDAVNDYETTAGSQVTVPAVTFNKTDLDPAVIPAIGKYKNFQIDIHLPEGTSRNIIVTDSLNAAGVSYLLANNAGFDITYTFQGIATVNGQAAGETAFNAFPADGSSGNAIWDIGTVVTQTENDTTQNAIDPLIRIQYFARVNNDLVTDSGDTLQNGAVLNYTHGETGAQVTLTDDTAAVTVVEPVLTATKTVSNVTPGKQPADPPSGGDLLEYVVAVLNSGTSTAYDVNVVDTLPSELSLYTGFTPTALINGAPAAGFVATPANAPDGPLVWGRGNGDGSLDIPVGRSLVLTYRVVVEEAGIDLSNSVMVDWTSLDGASSDERTGDGCPNWTAPNDYCTGPAVATTTTVDNNSIDKTVSADTFDTAPWSTAADAVARIGDFITYRLSINLSGGLTRNLRVQDTLPGGMAFVDTVSINGDTTANYTSPATGPGSNFAYAAISSSNVPAAGQTGTLTWNIGDIVNNPFGDPTTDSLVIIYRARILPDAGIAHGATTTLTNTVNMDYETAAGPATTRTDNASITVVQPDLTVTKSAVAAGGDTVLAANEIVTYTVDIANSGGAPAYDTLLTDVIPAGMRNGAATVTTVSMQLLSGAVWTNLAPVYDAATGVATWNFDTGVADQYTIPAGDTLRIVYQVQADTDIGAGLTLTNAAQIQHYYSLDDEDIPTQGNVNGERQTYGPSNVATVTFTTATPGALNKANPAVLTVSVGEPFTYRITVPAAPHDTALHDVRILDDLSASAADLVFVSVTKVSGSQPWTPVNTGSATNLVIEDTTTGIDIPAGEQIVIDVMVVLANTATNVVGLQFNNTADYTYNQISNDPTTRTSGGSDTTDNMTIVGAEILTLEKTGPATMQSGTPATFTLNVHNPNTGAAWNPVILDRMPHQATGGMCDVGPTNVTARIFQADGMTPVSDPLVQDTDFTISFDGDPTCEWHFNLLSHAGGIGPDQRLIVHYDAALDPSTENGITLTNVAGATRWYSADPNEAGAAPRIFNRTLSDGTPGTLDHEDRHIVTAEAPILTFEKSVQNMTTGQNPGSNASPGDILRYTIRLSNNGPVGLSSFSVVDEVDRLNAVPAFASGSLNLISVPAGADTSGTSASGGTHGTGLLNVANLSIGAQGESNDTMEIVFEVRLAPVITSGTVVLNQAELVSENLNQTLSDDPNVAGDTDPTQTLIASSPRFEVKKISTVMSGDATVLMAGETLRYTLTIKNIGSEDAVDVRLRDYTPANTTYVAGSTTLNGQAVADSSPGVSPLQTGILLHAPENATAGYLRADATAGANNVATVTFDVVVDPNAMNGLIIENQGFVSGSGAGSGPQPEQPSDDPNTPIPDDPTRNIVGNLPLLYAHKTVQIQEDLGSPGIVDPGDVLRYTIVVSNFGAIPATGVVLTDAVPANTVYVTNSLRLNGASPGSDGGVSPLIAGLSVNSDDNPGAGIISSGNSATITFDVRVNMGVSTGTLISNQGSVASNELPIGLTDADGVPSNGNQPTVVVVGDAQLLTVTKQVQIVGGGAAEAGGQMEYVIRVTNNGSLPAIRVVISDNLNPPLGDQVTYVAGSGTLNGSIAGVSYAGSILTADYAGQYGDLPPGASAVVRFRVQINPALAIGTTITNTGVVRWNDPTQSDSASVSIDVGGIPGSASLNGEVWHDADLDKLCDSNERLLDGWSVALYRNNQLVHTVTTDANGLYRLSGLVPNAGTADQYELRFRAAGAGANTPSLGYADSPFTDGPQRISAIAVSSGANLQNLNLPLWPNGAVYNSVGRDPIAGARVTLLNAATGAALPSQCFDDPAQQNQVTALDGFYKFDLNFSNAACPAGADYLIQVTPPATGYMSMPSQIIPPASDAATAAFSVPACPGSTNDAVPATIEYCEAVASAEVPPPTVQPRTAGTVYHMHLLLGNGAVPGQSQIFNNFIPIDPELNGAVAITKTSPLTNVTRGSLVPYTITVTNVYGVPLYDISIVDRFPAGFKYVAGSARLDGAPAEPAVNGRELTWNNLQLQVNQKYTIKLLLVVGSGVTEDEYVNRAFVLNTATNSAVSAEATATVRVIPDPTFDCTDVIGKVFDDRNLNGHQDKGEKGLPGVRVVTVRGLIATSDKYGRFHITCAAVPDEDRGSNFILKLDERTLPSGYRMTTENPRVQRATRGKMLRFDFGATIHHVVRIDIADGVFKPNTTQLRLQWTPKIARLLEVLKKAPSVLRLSYLADVERKGLVQDRLDALKKEIEGQWEQSGGGYRLTIETEIFWRRGAPVAGKR